MPIDIERFIQKKANTRAYSGISVEDAIRTIEDISQHLREKTKSSNMKMFDRFLLDSDHTGPCRSKNRIAGCSSCG
ncbi:MAG: hypothetical protein PHR06_09280 [Candidatus Cloacimonetes bacterium]|nr:hypothetical protein [Candidatus Cloacimonadota bacterium]